MIVPDTAARVTLGVSLLYTAVIIALVELELLRPVADYFPAASPR